MCARNVLCPDWCCMASCCARSKRIREIAIASLWCVAIISSCAGEEIEGQCNSVFARVLAAMYVSSVWVLIVRMLVLALCAVFLRLTPSTSGARGLA